MQRARLLTGAVVAAAVAAGGIGGAVLGVPGLSGAQSFPGSASTAAAAAKKPARTNALLDAAAKALGLTTQQLRDKLSDGKTTIADVARQQHVDVNAVIDAMAAADRSRISDIVNQPWPQAGPFGPGGPAFKPGLRVGFGRVAGVAAADVAKALGISTSELATDLRNGQTIADVARARHVDVNQVVTTLVGDASARIDQQVKNGNLTQAQATKLKSALQTMISNFVNNGLPKFPGMRGRFGRGGFGPPPGGPGADAPGTTSPPAA